MPSITSQYLRRYTELRYVLQILRTGKLALLDPNTWDDRNDSHFLMAYKEARQLRSLLAVCFTRVSERHHHWERFATRGGHKATNDADDRETICIEFDKESLLSSIGANPHVKGDVVRYSKLDALEKHPPRVDRWPFQKRYPYRDEREFRIIYSSQTATKSPIMLPIDLGAIARIIVGPYADIARREQIKKKILAVPLRREPLTVTKTTILDNSRWKKIVDRARATADRGQR